MPQTVSVQKLGYLKPSTRTLPLRPSTSCAMIELFILRLRYYTPLPPSTLAHFDYERSWAGSLNIFALMAALRAVNAITSL
eukprot:3648960-Rhodomonas_salina.2